MKPCTYINPVHPGYFADPFVWWSGEEYCAIGTGPAEAAGSVADTPEPSVFPLLRSADLTHWHPAGRAMVRPDPALGTAFWAPEVAHSGSQWFLYYSVGHGDRLHHLRVAVSDEPLGPYIDVKALTDPGAIPFAIDPHPFLDIDGRWYLFHARDFLDLVDEQGREVRAGTALVAYPLIGMTELGSPGTTVARARFDWQRFAAERPMYGQTFDWHTLEGPCMVRHGDRYYCLYSGGCWQTETYGVDYVVAERALGPYSDEGLESGPRVLRTVPGHALGPGHCSVVIDPEQRSHYIVYHAWDAELRARRMCIDPLVFTPLGPRSPGPSFTEQRLPLTQRTSRRGR